MSAVRVGQVWADNDKRSAGRKVRVVAIDADPHTGLLQPSDDETEVRAP